MIKMFRKSDLVQKQTYKQYQVTYYEIYTSTDDKEFVAEIVYIKSNFSKIEDMKYILTKFMKDIYIDIKSIEYIEESVLKF